mmetsp:Transcript_91061/g.254371  ORF Transcript_91061/g.254371 Transcript_91061/m.254371 type:complete len:231 (-) Transcript_91061:234-926(-)
MAKTLTFGPAWRASVPLFSTANAGKSTTGLNSAMEWQGLGSSRISCAYSAMPAPLPKPARTRRFQSSLCCSSFALSVSTSERPSSSTSCKVSRSSFSSVALLRWYHVPSVTSSLSRSKSLNASLAGCSVQATLTTTASLQYWGISLRALSSTTGSSPTKAIIRLGLDRLPISWLIRKGSSGFMAATLASVKRRLSHSILSFCRSSVSFRCLSCCSFSTAFLSFSAFSCWV